MTPLPSHFSTVPVYFLLFHFLCSIRRKWLKYRHLKRVLPEQPFPPDKKIQQWLLPLLVVTNIGYFPRTKGSNRVPPIRMRSITSTQINNELIVLHHVTCIMLHLHTCLLKLLFQHSVHIPTPNNQHPSSFGCY